jgi:AAHS family 4-hydroxybenzoate transporter-like MFS transporter
MQSSIESVSKHRPLERYQLAIIFVCFLVVLMDGYDTQAIGFTANAISQTRGTPLAEFGRLFSSGLLGSALGAFVLGPLGDRVGRRDILVFSLFIFAVFSFWLPHLHFFSGLLTNRFLTGLGLGGALPNVLALCAEHTPRRLRSVVTGILFAGFPAGGVVGAVITAQIVPVWGWQAVFYIGGVVPLILAWVVLELLPGPQTTHVQSDDPLLTAGPDAAGSERYPEISLLEVFLQAGVLPTILLWLSSFMCFVILIVIGLWTSVLLYSQGLDLIDAATAAGMFNLGSVTGTALGGKLLDRFPPVLVLPITFIGGAIFVFLLGQSGGDIYLLMFSALCAGAFIGSGSAQLLSVSVLIYPNEMRASGVGWVVAIGRAGQIFGPIAVGSLLASGMAIDHIYTWIAMPAVCAAVSVLWLCHTRAITRNVDLGNRISAASQVGASA